MTEGEEYPTSHACTVQILHPVLPSSRSVQK